MKNLKVLKLGQFFLEGLDKSDSAPANFYWQFLFNFILQNLKKEKRVIFLELVAEEKFDKVISFATKNINQFEKRFSQALGERLNKLNQKVLKGNQL